MVIIPRQKANKSFYKKNLQVKMTIHKIKWGRFCIIMAKHNIVK